MKPIRLRGVPDGRGGEPKASTRQRGCIARGCGGAGRAGACSTVSGCGAAIISIRSPWHRSGSRSSSGKVPIVVSRRGCLPCSPNRSSNRLAPTDTVTVSPSAGSSGPSTPESDGGLAMPTSGGRPPVQRKRARSVSVFISRDQLAAAGRRHVAGDVRRAGDHLAGDARLVHAVERDRLGRRGVAVGRGRRVAQARAEARPAAAPPSAPTAPARSRPRRSRPLRPASPVT